MSLLVAKPQIGEGVLVASQFRAHGVVDEIRHVMGHLGVRAQAEEDIARLPLRILLAPDLAIAEVGDRADAM